MRSHEPVGQAREAPHVLVVGSLNVDLILIADADAEPLDDGSAVIRQTRRLPGGHAGNCATALARLGAQVTVVATVGQDADGEFLTLDLQREGVDVRHIRRTAQPTGIAVIPVFGDRHYMLLARGANDLMEPSDVAKAVAEQVFDAIVLFDPSREVLSAFGTGTLEIARPTLLCWTPGGIYARDSLVSQVAPHCDVLLANREEFASLEARLPQIVDQNPALEVILTKGDVGATLYRDGQEVHSPAVVTQSVDPTGAGDAFCAGYVMALLAGFPEPQRLAAANRCGAVAVEEIGARGRLATRPVLFEVTR